MKTNKLLIMLMIVILLVPLVTAQSYINRDEDSAGTTINGTTPYPPVNTLLADNGYGWGVNNQNFEVNDSLVLIGSTSISSFGPNGNMGAIFNQTALTNATICAHMFYTTLTFEPQGFFAVENAVDDLSGPRLGCGLTGLSSTNWSCIPSAGGCAGSISGVPLPTVNGWGEICIHWDNSDYELIINGTSVAGNSCAATPFSALGLSNNGYAGEAWDDIRVWQGDYQNEPIVLPPVNNTLPTHDDPVLNFTDNPLNTSSADITVFNRTTFDVDGDLVHNVYDFRVGGTSLARINFPFELGSDSVSTKDFSTFASNGTVNGATYNPTSGFDGRGAYRFDGVDDTIDSFYNPDWTTTGFTVLLWVNDTGTGGEEALWGSASSFELRIRTNTKLQLGIGGSSDNVNRLKGIATIPKNEWTHIGVTFDPENGMNTTNFYVNGVIDVSVLTWSALSGLS